METYECPHCLSGENMHCHAKITITYGLHEDGKVEDIYKDDVVTLCLDDMETATCTACGFKGTLKEFQKSK